MEGRTKTGDIDNIRVGRFGGLLFCSGSFLPPPIPLAEKVTFFARAGLEAMATIYNAVVFGGIGVFSKNIKYQIIPRHKGHSSRLNQRAIGGAPTRSKIRLHDVADTLGSCR